jgi:hypothetical protein
MLLATGLKQYRTRMADPYLKFSDYYTYRWMQGGAAQLAAAQVPSQATILVIGEDSPNMSLVYFDRRGLVWNPDRSQLLTSAVLQKMTDVGLDYLVMRQAIFQEVAQHNPDLPTAFQPLISTSQYVVLKRRNAPRHWN